MAALHLQLWHSVVQVHSHHMKISWRQISPNGR